MLGAVSAADLLAQMDRWIDELARKWERFFAHDPQVPVPPERERAALDRRLKELSRQEARTAAEQFRIEQVLHRFTTYSALWQRQLREREEARKAAAVASRTPNVPPPAAVPTSGNDYRRLHTSYLAALRRSGKDAEVTFESFRRTLEAQRRALAQRGAAVEEFEVVEESGQVKVRARVRRGRKS